MPKVTIISPTEAHPNPVPLKRDDQTIMFELAEGLEWANLPPLVLLAGGGDSPSGIAYSDWPTATTNPAPIDNGAVAQRRPYFLSANAPRPQGVTEMYHYAMDIAVVLENGAREIHHLKVLGADGGWHDPDVVNEPKP